MHDPEVSADDIERIRERFGYGTTIGIRAGQWCEDVGTLLAAIADRDARIAEIRDDFADVDGLSMWLAAFTDGKTADRIALAIAQLDSIRALGSNEEKQ
jgi:hypothetical protein